jgi:hypothetical protein
VRGICTFEAKVSALLAFGLAITANFPAFARVAGSGSSLLSHVSQYEYFEGGAERNWRNWGEWGKREGSGGAGKREEKTGVRSIAIFKIGFYVLHRETILSPI